MFSPFSYMLFYPVSIQCIPFSSIFQSFHSGVCHNVKHPLWGHFWHAHITALIILESIVSSLFLVPAVSLIAFYYYLFAAGLKRSVFLSANLFLQSIFLVWWSSSYSSLQTHKEASAWQLSHNSHFHFHPNVLSLRDFAGFPHAITITLILLVSSSQFPFFDTYLSTHTMFF